MWGRRPLLTLCCMFLRSARISAGLTLRRQTDIPQNYSMFKMFQGLVPSLISSAAILVAGQRMERDEILSSESSDTGHKIRHGQQTQLRVPNVAIIFFFVRFTYISLLSGSRMHPRQGHRRFRAKVTEGSAPRSRKFRAKVPDGSAPRSRKASRQGPRCIRATWRTTCSVCERNRC